MRAKGAYSCIIALMIGSSANCGPIKNNTGQVVTDFHIYFKHVAGCTVNLNPCPADPATTIPDGFTWTGSIEINNSNGFDDYSWEGAPIGTLDSLDVPGLHAALKTYYGNPYAYTRWSNLGNELPEPASWAMMLSGFGLVGRVLRGRRKFVARYTSS